MTIVEGKGEISITLPWDRIQRVNLPEVDWGKNMEGRLKEQSARDVLENLRRGYEAWIPLMPLMKEDQLIPLLNLVRLEASAGSGWNALQLARLLERKIETPAVLNELQQWILRLLRDLSPDEAMLYAESWVAAKPWYKGRLFGYWALADIELQRGNAEKALWVSLEAIVCGGGISEAWLSHCYVAAMAAGLQLQELDLAGRLLKEMTDRQIVWPDSLPEIYQAVLFWAQSNQGDESIVSSRKSSGSQVVNDPGEDRQNRTGIVTRDWREILRKLRTDR